MKVRHITPPQIRRYWQACHAACQNLGISGSQAVDEYRRSVMQEVCGKTSVKQLDRTADFDAVMSRFYEDAGDYSNASQYLVGDSRRVGYIIKVCAIQLMQLKGSDQREARRYLAGVLDQCRIAHGVQLDTDTYWMDLTFGEAMKVFQILDTHRRRLMRGYSSRQTTFSPCVRYVLSGPILIRQHVPADYYATQPFNVTLSA